MLKELIRAEKEAEKVLKRHWGAVEKLAESLLRRQSGRMTGKQVRRLIGEVESPTSHGVVIWRSSRRLYAIGVPRQYFSC